MSKSYGQDCPVAKTLDLLGDRWTLLVVRDLLRGKTRFSELFEGLAGIPSNLLAERLKCLETAGIVERHYYSEYPPRAEYRLTQKGKDLRKVIAAISEWGAGYALEAPEVMAHEGCDEHVGLEWFCPKCGWVDPASVRRAATAVAP